MKISVVCSGEDHPVFPKLLSWAETHRHAHDVRVATSIDRAGDGDILFLISCHDIVGPEIRSRFRHCLVVHASGLPRGRGWSPHVWQVLDGESVIPVTLLEAAESVDSGPIWHQVKMRLEGHELYDEINERLFTSTLHLMDFAMENEAVVSPRAQAAAPATYYPRRTPDDSRLDPEMSLAAQFEMLRVADPARYPNFFEYRGHRYSVTVRKMR